MQEINWKVFEQQVENEIEKAHVGKKIWDYLIEKYDIDESVGVVIFPGHDKELEIEAQKMLEEYREKKYLKNLVCVSAENIKSTKTLHCELMLQEEISLLLKYYLFVQPVKTVVVISYNVPFGNGDISNMLNGKNLKKSDYVRLALMGGL